MQFKLRFDMDNAAFEEDPHAEIARILRVVADKVGTEGLVAGVCRDINGNGVGSYAIAE